MTTLSLPHELPRAELNTRFWKKIDVCHHGRRCKECCWTWASSTWSGRYGQVYFGRDEGKRIRVQAHRFAWELRYKTAIPSGLLALHTCDRPFCVNPTHIFIGTQSHNIQDAARKGPLTTGDKSGARLHTETRATGDRNGARTMPHRIVRGEQKANAKLTEENIRTIRRAYTRGHKSVRQLATQHGVGRSTIHHIVTRQTWGHVTQDPRLQSAANQRRHQPREGSTTG